LLLAVAGAAMVRGQQVAVDTVLTNGKIITVDDRFSIAQAVAIRGDRFVAVGSNQDIARLAGPSTRRIDLGGKAVLPIPRFGGAAEKIYTEELASFDSRYAGRLSRDQFEDLAQLNSNPKQFAKTVVSLAERIQVSRSVLVVMSFCEDPALADAYDSFKEICSEFDYECARIDQECDVPRVMPELLQRLGTCAFCIVDLSHEKANVYYELGYAEASKRPVIVTAKKNTPLPFDVKDIPVIFWDSQKSLKEQLRKRIKSIAAQQGR